MGWGGVGKGRGGEDRGWSGEGRVSRVGVDWMGWGCVDYGSVG